MNRRRLPVFLCLLLAAVACLVGVTSPSSTQADTTPNSWLDKTIESEKRGDLSAENFNKRYDTWNQCVDVTVEYKYYPWYFTPLPLLGEREDCMTPGATGYFHANNRPRQIVQYGTKRVQLINEPVTDMSTWTGPMYHVPYTNRLIHLHNSWGGSWGTNGAHTAYLKVIDNWNDTFKVSSYIGDAGNISLEKVKDADYTLEENGTDVQGVSSNGLEVSANGEWLHVLLPNRSYVLLNLDTHEVKPYADSNQPMYAMRADVSNDGRFVARSYDLNSLKIYDTTRCRPAQGKFESRDCESIELLEGDDSILRKLFPGKEITIGRLNFVGNGDALDIDLRIGTHPNVELFTYRFRPSGSEPVKYLAMGDSFSSGEGAFDYFEATDMFVSDEEYNVCHLSRKSYPYLLQQSLRADWFHSVACSGSQSKDVFYPLSNGDYIADGESKAKIKLYGIDKRQKIAYAAQESSVYENSIRPGYVPQNNFVTKHAPNIVTISMGGNDVGFEGMVGSCIFKGITLIQTCFSGREERESKANEIDQKISMWSKNFVDIKNSLGGSDPKLYVIGYPKIVDTNLTYKCGMNVPFDDAERLLTDKMIEYLNTAVKVAADAAGVRYVDVSDAFTRSGEERLCGPGPMFAANGLDLRSQISLCTSATAPEALACPNSFHPNARGHALLSDTIMVETTNLTQTMPQNANSTADLVNKRMEFVGDVNITLQSHRITYWKDIAPALIAKGEKIQINLPLSNSELPAKAGTTATATAHSTPRVLGELPISADGNISGELTLPVDIEAGYHRLIISYTDIADNTVERYSYFYAAHSVDDFDGDGINNTSDPCPSVLQSNVDQDADAIDDACDNEYVKSAQTSSPDGQANGETNPSGSSDSKQAVKLVLNTENVNPFETGEPVFKKPFIEQNYKNDSSVSEKSGASNESNQSGYSQESNEGPLARIKSLFAVSGVAALIVASIAAWVIIRRNVS